MPLVDHPGVASPRHGAHRLHLRVCSIASYAGPEDPGPAALVTMDSKATSVAQLHAAIEQAWAMEAQHGAVSPSLEPCVALYTAAAERITKMSQMQDGDTIIFATSANLRPFTPQHKARSEQAQQVIGLALAQPRPRDTRRRRRLEL
jgi:hypothetical protein